MTQNSPQYISIYGPKLNIFVLLLTQIAIATFSRMHKINYSPPPAKQHIYSTLLLKPVKKLFKKE